MKPSESISAFFKDFPKKSCCAKISIKNIPQCIESIENVLKSKGQVGDEIAKTIYNNLRAICPICCVWTPPDPLIGVSLASRMGRSNVIFPNYGPRAHLLDGNCVVDKCPSKEIFLIWRGDDALRTQVITHIARVRDSAQQGFQNSLLTLLQELSSDKVLNFTIDTLWALRRNVADKHLYLRHNLENLVLWVSVIPYLPPLAKEVFENGYAGFLETILDESGYDTGEISVAHWVCMGDAFSLVPEWKSLYDIAWHVNLTLVSKKNLPKQDRFFIAASELS